MNTNKNTNSPALESETISVCGDCYQAIGIGDMSFLDYYYCDRGEADEREAEIWRGVESYRGTLHAGNSHEEFSSSRCDCCGTSDAGARHEAIHLYTP